MNLAWYGEGAFRLETHGVTVSIDPFDNGIGLTAPRFQYDILLTTSGPLIKPYISQKAQEQPVVSTPGMYDIKDIEIRGFTAQETTVYLLKTEELTIGILGCLANASLLEADVLEALQGVHILCVPVDAAPLVKQLEPKIVIPCFYAVPGLKREAGTLEQFTKLMGQHPEPTEKFSIKAKDINWEGSKLVILKI